MADFELKGVREVVERLQAKPRQVRQACAVGLKGMGDRIVHMSREYYVPVDTHTLQKSIKDFPAETYGDQVSVKIEAGSHGAEAYAIYVHERTDLHHMHGQAKYLDAPIKLMANPTGVDFFLARPIREALERGPAR
jgi:hypothetical protein